MMEASPTQTYQIVYNTVKPDGPVGGEALVSRPKLTQVGEESKVDRTPTTHIVELRSGPGLQA